jgi:E3 ubiquitin-protein ligase makorin
MSQCIKQWRDPKNKPGGVLESGNTKKCPMCRASTNFIIPSSKFWKAGTKEKDETIKAYRESMSRVSCRCVYIVLATYALLM